MGRSFDPLANASMAGQNITITTPDGQTIQTQTDTNGNYSTKVQTAPNGLVNVLQGAGGIEGDTCDLIASGSYLTCNFNLGKPPFDEDGLTQFFNQDSTTSLAPKQGLIGTAKAASEPDLSKFQWVVIDGVTYKPFVTLKDPRYPVDLSSIKDKIIFDQKWIQTLKNATGVTDDFPIMIVPQINWLRDATNSSNAGGYLQDGVHSWMVLSVVALDYTNGSISHEFGHHVDWMKGFTDSQNHHYSSDNWNFKTAEAGVSAARAITGYATTNSREMFAEFFATMMEPLGNDPTQIDTSSNTGQFLFASRVDDYLRAKPSLTIYLLGSQYIFNSEGTTGRSNLMSPNISVNLKVPLQNDLMYLYKHVAKVSNQNEYFPGNVSLGLITPGPKLDIPDGHYMSGKSVVTAALLDHHGAPLGDANLSLGGQTQPIHAGNYSWTSGTYKALMPVPTGIQNITVSNLPADYPIPFAGEKVNLVDGSNYVEVGYQKITVQYMVYQNAAGVLPMLPLQFIGSFQAKSGATTTGITSNANGGTPTTLRYPTEGHSLGFYGSPTPLPSGLKGYSYLIDYVVGGNADLLYPIKETLTGPAPFPKMASPTKTEFSFDPKTPIPTGPVILVAQTAPHSISGIFQKQCSYDSTFTSTFCAALKW